MGRVVGIDLGTTNSVVAIVEVNGVKILHNRENETQTRSVVGFHNGQYLVGTPALRRWPLAPKDTVLSIKRLIGRAIADPEVAKVRQWALYDVVEPADGTKDSVRVKLGGKEASPIEVSAKILGKLKADAEAVLGEPVTHAVITVPAYFSDKQRHATREAGLKAGLTVMKILDEPTAAAIAFGMTSGEEDAKTILVYDLGGGTFDVSVLMKAAGTFAQLNLEGDMWLGGDDLDQVLIQHVCERIKRDHGVDPTGNHGFMAVLRSEAQKAKETLSSAESAEILITGQLKDRRGQFINLDFEIGRGEFERLIRPLIDRSLAIVDKAISNANLSIAEIDHVLLAGNATAVPLVQRELEAKFGRDKILRKVHPKQAVAIGAAIAGASLKGPECPQCHQFNDFSATTCAHCHTTLAGTVETKRCPSCGAESATDAELCESCRLPFLNLASIRGGIAPFSYGIQTAGDRFHVFISKGDAFPTDDDKILVQTFFTSRANQRMICIPVYGGDHLDVASRNDKQGEVFAILPPSRPEGTPVKVRLFLDADGSFAVDTALESGEKLQPLILRGDADQKAVDVFMEAEERLATKKLALKPEEMQQVEQYRNQTLTKMASRDFEGAVRAARDYAGVIENVDKGGDPVINKAEGLIGWTRFVLETYGFLLEDPQRADLAQRCDRLEQAIKRRDQGAIAQQTEDLDIATDRICETRKPNGETVPTWIGIFMGIRHTVNRVSEHDLPTADRLRAEQRDVEAAFRAQDPSFEPKMDRFMEHLKAAREKYLGGSLKCHQCGTANAAGRTRCSSCGTNLLVLADDRNQVPTRY